MNNDTQKPSDDELNGWQKIAIIIAGCVICWGLIWAAYEWLVLGYD